MGGRGSASHRASRGGFTTTQRFLENAYGSKHAGEIMKLLEKAPKNIQELWQEFGPKLRDAGEDPYMTGAYYSPRENNVHLGIEVVAAGDPISTPYQTIFHEYGHMMDSLIARQLGISGYAQYSEIYQNGLLGRTAKAEMQAHLERAKRLDPMRVTDHDAASFIIAEAKRKYRSSVDRGDLSDIMEGAGIGRGYPLGAGHGLDYYMRRDNGVEIFAEITDASVANPGALKAIKDYFPKTYQVYQDMLKERKKHK